MVHTFDGEILSASSTSSFHSTIPNASATTPASNTANIQTEFGLAVQLIHHVNGKLTSLGRVGPFITLNILEDKKPKVEEKWSEQKNASAPLLPPPPMDIVIRIPQKFNISCFARGDFIVGGRKYNDNNNNFEGNGKLEGDVHLRTSSGGNIVLHGKVRGHDVTVALIAKEEKHEGGRFTCASRSRPGKSEFTQMYHLGGFVHACSRSALVCQSMFCHRHRWRLHHQQIHHQLSLRNIICMR